MRKRLTEETILLASIFKWFVLATIIGITAGFASVFDTPVAGAICGVEVLFVGDILYEVPLPSFIAGVTAYQISTSFGISYFYHPLNFMPKFSEAFFVKVAVAGLFFGLCS